MDWCPNTSVYYFSILAEEASKKLVADVCTSLHSQSLPADRCPVCNKLYKDLRTLKTHIQTRHPETYYIEGEEQQEVDQFLNHSKQLVKVLLIKRAMDYAIESGNGQDLSLIMKHMTLYYRQLGYTHYALSCFEHTAQMQVFLSERLREIVQQECFVNTTGKKNRNKAMDLDLEHANLFFKNSFTLKSNEPAQELLDTLSLAQDHVEQILNNYYKEFEIRHYTSVRTRDDDGYLRDVAKLHKHLCSKHIAQAQVGREFQSNKLKMAAHDPLLLIDMFDTKQWFKSCYKRMQCQRFLKKD